MEKNEQDAREGSERIINRQPYLKLLFFFRKLPTVSEEYFNIHWSTFHADLSTAAKPFLIASRRYVQFHVDKKLSSQITGMEPLPFDGCSELWVKDLEAWHTLQQSPEYANAFTDDNKKFLQLPFKFMIGYDDLIYGSAVPGEGGADGKEVEGNIIMAKL